MPRKYKDGERNDYVTNLSVSIPREMKKELEGYAQQLGMNKSELVREILTRHLKEHYYSMKINNVFNFD